jgi:hypothetical protein
MFKGREYNIEYSPSTDAIVIEYKGSLTDEECYILKKYLRLEGFIDRNLTYYVQ